VKDKTATNTLRLCVEPDETGYHAWCPELKGCHTCGDTILEAQMNCCEAIHAYLLSTKREGGSKSDENH